MSAHMSFQNWKKDRTRTTGHPTGRSKSGDRVFGGSLLEGRRKSSRPLSRKHVIHLVMKSSQARGPQSFLRPRLSRMVSEVFRRQAKLAKVTILDFVNVGNHLHVTVRIHDRERYKQFVRATAGLIARKSLEKERGPAAKEARLERIKKTNSNKAGFWDYRPFTRIVYWGREVHTMMSYLEKNKKQSEVLLEKLFSAEELFSSA